ncbi:glycolipid 2-alpha-mannosyltransferase-domain-containing protein [Mycena rosella]|uniref:Glycolipid 2-alpha-mannosyltransferase-domain-containing protein n=1 Tax=Mycena rosella TaxID=1033263 RepID=A0AAD7BSA7_MYCRO|nr:glycolipid 2-alpha-mannosyltransferase-domain-containing protein [Mycena rosella]
MLAAVLLMLYTIYTLGYTPRTSLQPLAEFVYPGAAPALPVSHDRPSYTAAVVYLASVLPGPRSPTLLFKSLSLMHKNIPWRYQWPVLIFHAGAYDTRERRDEFGTLLRNVTGTYGLTVEETEQLVRRLEFVSAHHELPEGVPTDGAKDDPVFSHGWPAYHHMCAFYAYKILSHPRITPLTYFLRLDDDSSILPPGTCIDPFEYMHAHNLSYAYREKIDDAGWVTRGMWPFVSSYARRHVGADERMARNGWGWVAGRAWPGGMEYGEDQNFPSYRTNFDLIKVPRFLAPDVRAFNEELVSDPMRFYWYRWGDAPVRRAQVDMFLEHATEVYHMCEIPYEHKGEVFGGDCDCAPLPSLG